VARRAAAVRDEHVGHSGAFASGQPSHDEGVGSLDFIGHGERAAIQQHAHHRNPCGLQAAGGLKVGLITGAELKGFHVALVFSVRLLAVNEQGNVRLRLHRAGRHFGEPHELHGSARFLDRRAQAVEDACGAGEIRVFDIISLPSHRPSAQLAGDMSCRRASHQHPAAGSHRQHAAVVLQKNQRFPHRAAGEGAVLGVADPGRALPCGGGALRRQRTR